MSKLQLRPRICAGLNSRIILFLSAAFLSHSTLHAQKLTGHLPRLVTVGTPYTVNLAILDANGKTDEANHSAVNITNTDPIAVPTPASINFKNGVGSVVIVFRTVGPQTVTFTNTPVGGGTVTTSVKTNVVTYDDPCSHPYNDCDWQYTITGGGEESAMSSQDSQTNPFVNLFVRSPAHGSAGTAWLQARFLGSANANNTNNVLAATQSATGSSSTSGLPQVGTAIDYTLGVEYDFRLAKNGSAGDPDVSGKFTWGIIAGLGATTPLSSQHATTAYVSPAYGSNECSELISRFPASAGSPGLPDSKSNSNYPYVLTITTPISGNAEPKNEITGPFCIINPVTTTKYLTVNSVPSKVVTTGTAQQDIAFAPQDRNSFLLKYMVGLRLINREHTGSTTRCAPVASDDNSEGPCTRSIADITVGQDEAITGGMLRRFVAKADATFPIPKTSLYFFGSAAVRFEKNKNQSPLVLQSATIVSASPTPPATTTVPSDSTWVLPLTQPNRDFYRIGLGIDLKDVLSKIIPK